MLLSSFIFLPLLTALAILFCKGLRQVRIVSLIGSALQLVMAVVLLMTSRQLITTGTLPKMLYEFNYSWFTALNINYHIGVDGISIAMILLTAVIVLSGVLMSWQQETLSKEFFFLLMFLSVGAYGFFVALDLFLMFFFLELAVIPKFLLIAIWGSGKKEYSAMKLGLMLMAGSALVLVGLLGLYYHSGTGDSSYNFDLLKIARMNISIDVQRLFFPFLFAGFGIFAALFPFHTWVPDGHSSAPTAASMFLAGISMKLGGYGCLRVAAYLMPEAARVYAPVIIVLSTIAIIYGAFATMMQKDLKYINAYSSVSHCGIVLLGIAMLNQTAISGAVMQMVSHGLMTALLFAAIGMMYSRTHTRMVAQLGGLLKMMPFISTVFVIAGLCSLGLPGFSGFVAEITVFMGAWQTPGNLYRIATILACASIVVTAVYIIRAIGKTVMGPVENPYYENLPDATWNERLAAILMVVGILAIGIAPFWLMNLITPATEFIMKRIAYPD